MICWFNFQRLPTETSPQFKVQVIMGTRISFAMFFSKVIAVVLNSKNFENCSRVIFGLETRIPQSTLLSHYHIWSQLTVVVKRNLIPSVMDRSNSDRMF